MTRSERSFWIVMDVVVPVCCGIGLAGYMLYGTVRQLIREAMR